MTFSIIIPVYNVAPYLRECLDSVLAQTYTDWEAICVDDGSTDSSGEILNEYASRDTRIVVLHQANSGVSVARNVALEAVKGEYLVYIDADDYVAKDYLARIAEVIRQNSHPDVIRLSGFQAVANDGTVTKSALASAEGEDSVRQLCSVIIGNASLWLNVYRREPFALIRFPVGVRYGEDDVYLMRLLSSIRSLTQTDIDDGYYYRYLREGAASRVLTCHDISVLFSSMQSELSARLMNEDSKGVLRTFCRAYIRKNIFRATQKSSRLGSRELCLWLRENSRMFDIYDDAWRWADRLKASFFVNTGFWTLCDLMAFMSRCFRVIQG